MANNKQIRPLVFTVVFLFIPLFYASFAAKFYSPWGVREIPEWTSLERIITAVLALIAYSSPVFIGRLILSKFGEKLKNKGKNPDLVVLIYGYFILIIPPYFALAFSWLGCPVIDVYIYSALSFFAIIIWSWHNRYVFSLSDDSIYKSTESGVTMKEVTPVKTVRAYTIILFILGVLFLSLTALSVFVLMLPAEYDSEYNPLSVIVWALFYIIMMIGCWCAAFLRKNKSSYAIPVTEVIGYLLIIFFPFGTAAFIYWFGWVRKKERKETAKKGTNLFILVPFLLFLIYCNSVLRGL
jgi:hypothetical protein